MPVNYVLSLRRSGCEVTIQEVRHVYRTAGNVHLENEDEMRKIASRWPLGRHVVRLRDRTSLVSCRTTGFDLRGAERGVIRP